jgi:hypothetical protein
MESLVDKLRAHLESPEGKEATIAYFKKIEDEKKRIEGRAMQVIKSIKDLSDETIHQKLVDFLAWEEKYEEMWYSRCVQTSSRAFGVLLKVIEMVGDDFESDEDFFSCGYSYKGYIFKCYCGQGWFWRIQKGKEIIFQTT